MILRLGKKLKLKKQETKELTFDRLETESLERNQKKIKNAKKEEMRNVKANNVRTH